MFQAPSMRELTGELLGSSDIRSTPYKLQYLKSVAVGPGTGQSGCIRMTCPRSKYLDLSTLRFRTELTVATTDAASTLDGSDIGTIFDRVKVYCGNRLLYDCENNALIKNWDKNLQVTEHDATSYCNYKALYPQDATKSNQTAAINTKNFRLSENWDLSIPS